MEHAFDVEVADGDVGAQVDAMLVRQQWLAPATTLDRFLEFESLLDDAVSVQVAANRAVAKRMDLARRALDLARRRPELVLERHALQFPDADELAERAAAADLAMRLTQPEGTVRAWAHECTTAQERMPRVWTLFAEGICSYSDVRAALDGLAVLGAADDDALEEFDREASAIAGTVTTSRLRAKLRSVVARLAPSAERHRRAFSERRVVVEADVDGMAWLSLRCSQIDASRVFARLTATAERDAGALGETRTIDQLRADAAVGWLSGDGTPTAASIHVVVTVPAVTLVGSDEPGSLLDGSPVDPGTARELFAQAPMFRRLVIDPVTAAPLTLDRRRYRPTRAQREWLALQYGTCTAPGCSRLATTIDVDHLHDWAKGGTTDVQNLHPACRHHHRLKHVARFTVERGPAGSVSWTTPTGYRATADPPPF